MPPCPEWLSLASPTLTIFTRYPYGNLNTSDCIFIVFWESQGFFRGFCTRGGGVLLCHTFGVVQTTYRVVNFRFTIFIICIKNISVYQYPQRLHLISIGRGVRGADNPIWVKKGGDEHWFVIQLQRSCSHTVLKVCRILPPQDSWQTTSCPEFEVKVFKGGGDNIERPQKIVSWSSSIAIPHWRAILLFCFSYTKPLCPSLHVTRVQQFHYIPEKIPVGLPDNRKKSLICLSYLTQLRKCDG